MQPIFIVDSFTSDAFKGNPAGVVTTSNPLNESRMQSIAAELNLSETAFVTALAEDKPHYSIRYFSPLQEIPLCGHATLASSKVLFEKSNWKSIQFRTHSGIELNVNQVDDRIEMAFPVYALAADKAPDAMLKALGVKEVSYAGFNSETNILMLEIESAELLKDLAPDFGALKDSHETIHGVLVTAAGNDEFDFHSRFFWPWSGGEEDPVTGATHTFMAKYWADKLGKSILQSFQASKRTGQMEVEITSDHSLLIRGAAVLVLEGELKV